MLLTGLAPGQHLTLSNDGRALTYARKPEEKNVWTIDLTLPKDNLRRLTTGTGAVCDPEISPDGQWIAAVSGANKTRIIKIPSRGGTAVPLTSGEWLDQSLPRGRPTAAASPSPPIASGRGASGS